MIAVNTGIEADSAFGAVTPPICLSSTFAFSGFERRRSHDYSRAANPSCDILADALTELERGAAGSFGSGHKLTRRTSQRSRVRVRNLLGRSCIQSLVCSRYTEPFNDSVPDQRRLLSGG